MSTLEVQILRGIPGAGKSTYVKSLVDSGVRVEVVSADHFFMQNGVYRFNPRLLGEAHDQCWNKYTDLLYTDHEEPLIIVVDNTNTRMRECRRYYESARDLDLNVKIVNILCDPEVAAARNIHGVPREKVLEMHRRMIEAEIPPDWNQITIEE